MNAEHLPPKPHIPPTTLPSGVVAQAGDFTLVVERSLDRIQEFWALSYSIVVREFGARQVRFWPIEHHPQSVYITAYEGSYMVGGMRIVTPIEGPLYTYSQLGSLETMPDQEYIRSLGVIGEAASLVLVAEARGRVDLEICNRVMRSVAQAAGLTHLILNGVIPWRVPALYSVFGFVPYAPPQIDLGLLRYPGDDRPNVLPMIAPLYPDAPLPDLPPPVSIADLERMSRDYLAD